MYLLDSNVYIRGFNDSKFGEELREFHGKYLPNITFSVVVMHELLKHRKDKRASSFRCCRERQRSTLQTQRRYAKILWRT